MKKNICVILIIVICILTIFFLFSFTIKKQNINVENIIYINLGVIPEISSDNAKFLNNNIYINEGGTYSIKGVFVNGTIYIDTKDEVNLIFNNVTIVNEYQRIIDNRKSKFLKLILANGSNNILSDGVNSNSVIKSVGNVSIEGKGDLLIYGNNENGITITNGGLCLEDLTLYVITKKDPFDVKKSFIINSGTILGLGNGSMQLLDEESKQNSFLFNFDNQFKEGTKFVLQNSKEKNILIFEALRGFKTLLLSTSKLKPDYYHLLTNITIDTPKKNGIYIDDKIVDGIKLKIGLSDTFWIKGKNNWYGNMNIINHYVNEIVT